MSEQTWDAPPEGSPCWMEIPARDSDKLKDFYSALFPSWKFKPVDPERDQKVHQYEFTKPDGLTGGIVQMPENSPVGTQAMGYGFTPYFLVEDVDKAVEKIEGLGGKVVLDKRPEGKNGLFANVVDPEGNRFGIYQWLGGAA